MNLTRLQSPLHFEEILKVNEQKLTLSFNKIYTPYGDKYFVKGEDDDKKCFVFEMIKKDISNKWRIIGSLQWLKTVEEELSDFIKNHN